MWKIQLQAAGLNKWLDDMEQKLTIAQDMLDMIETETEQLKKIWESEAGRRWKAEFQVQIGELRNRISKMKESVLALGETSRLLADMESNMTLSADQL